MSTHEKELKDSLIEKAKCSDAIAESIAVKWFDAGLTFTDLMSATDMDINDEELKLSARDKVRRAYGNCRAGFQPSCIPSAPDVGLHVTGCRLTSGGAVMQKCVPAVGLPVAD